MLKLPLCPYCGARFLYRQVRRNGLHGTGVCPHCGETFRIRSLRGLTLLLAVSVAAMIGVNILLMQILDMNLSVLSVVTALEVTVTWLLFPYAVRYCPRAQSVPARGQTSVPARRTETKRE